MANFFRRIRRQLFTKNKFTKYLIYATGEIFLVVIGILIALQVNNYNEQRKTEIKEKKYLVSIKNELLNNLEVIKAEAEHLNTSLKAQRQVMSLINSKIDTISENELSKILGLSFNRGIQLKYQDGTFKELLYSGGLIAIANDSIRNKITSWEGRMIIVTAQEEGVFEARNGVTEYIMEFGDFKIILDDLGAAEYLGMEKSIKRVENKELLKSKIFENNLALYIVVGTTLQFEYEQLERDIHNLLRMINNEIKLKTKG